MSNKCLYNINYNAPTERRQLMSSITSKTSYDLEPYMIVPVIASFDAKRHIAPLYVRVNGEAYKVNSYWVKSRFAYTYEFNAQLISDERLIPVMLTYHQREGVWTIPPIMN